MQGHASINVLIEKLDSDDEVEQKLDFAKEQLLVMLHQQLQRICSCLLLVC